MSRVKACLSFWADMKAWELQHSGDLIHVPIAKWDICVDKTAAYAFQLCTSKVSTGV